MLKENPARLVPTPKLPKRIPSVLSAEENERFLNQLLNRKRFRLDRLTAPWGGGGAAEAALAKRIHQKTKVLLLRRDRRLPGASLRCRFGASANFDPELNLADMDRRRERCLRVRGKGKQGTHCSLRWQGAGSARGLLAGSRTDCCYRLARGSEAAVRHSEAIF